MKHEAVLALLLAIPAPKKLLPQHPFQEYLAPPPINFTHEEVPVDDKIMDVDYKDNKLEIHEHRESKMINPIFPILIVCAAIFWGSLFFAFIYFVWGLKAVFDVMIAGLLAILFISVWFTFKRK